jgi:putative transposase
VARKPLERSNFYPYHVYNRTLESNFYPINSKIVWDKSTELLSKLTVDYGAKIHAFVLMSNHYHLLISTPKENLDECIWYYQSCFANWMCKLTDRKIYSFESRYKWSIIKNLNHYQTVYRYILRNPVRAGICDRVEKYAFSSAMSQHLKSLIQDHEFMLQLNDLSILNWLNSEESSEMIEKTKRGLRHKVFSPPKRIHVQSGVAPLYTNNRRGT